MKAKDMLKKEAENKPKEIKIRKVNPELHKKFVKIAKKSGKTTGDLYNELLTRFISEKESASDYLTEKKMYSIIYRQSSLQKKVKLIIDWILQHHIDNYPKETMEQMTANRYKYVVSDMDYEEEYIGMVQANQMMEKKNSESDARKFMESTFIRLPYNHFEGMLNMDYVSDPEFVVWKMKRRSVYGKDIDETVVGRVRDFSAFVIDKVIEYYQQKVEDLHNWNKDVDSKVLTKLKSRRGQLEKLADKVANDLFGPLWTINQP